MNSRSLLFSLFLLLSATAAAQLSVRPDALPPEPDMAGESKALLMASDSATMADWKHYPTYDYYVEMMQRYAQHYPQLCRLDTIGRSVDNRLILCVRLSNNGLNTTDLKPQVFYSSTIHGDELVGFHMMLHLIDTLLSAYGTSPQISQLLNSTDVYINPLSNPDGTYYGGNHTVQFSRRYNANGVDLNRNYPDPFSATAKRIEPENEAMIAYVEQHSFLLAANLHSGSEVMNYPWDSFTSMQRSHPDAEWWMDVSRRFVDTCRQVSPQMFTDVVDCGYIAGGDWYVISGGRQDYMNYYHNIHELTMELSKDKKVASDNLPRYWRSQCQSLINYLCEVHTMPGMVGVPPTATVEQWRVYPNPTRGSVTVESPTASWQLDLSRRPAGVYLIPVGGHWVRVVKI